MATYKVQFIKDKKGQTYYERSLSLEDLQLLLIVCDDCQAIKNKRNSGCITFIFTKPGMNLYCKAIKLPVSVMAKLVAEMEWKK
jgi:hypothetical protein